MKKYIEAVRTVTRKYINLPPHHKLLLESIAYDCDSEKEALLNAVENIDYTRRDLYANSVHASAGVMMHSAGLRVLQKTLFNTLLSLLDNDALKECKKLLEENA